MESTPLNAIKDDSQVLIKKGKNIKIFRVKKGRDIFMDNTKLSLDGAIGHPFGTTFEVVKGHLVKVAKESNKEIESAGKDTEGSQVKDNRDLYDLDSNQKLSKEEIESLKKDGLSGNELVEQLIENSLTFQNKTEYSKEKYIKKKKQKHVPQFTILRPTTRLLCEMYITKSAQKICYLRLDTLAQMLTYGNIHAGTTVAVVDTCLGLVVGAVMERLGGFGKVIHIYHESIPNRTAVESYDFPAEMMKTLYSFPLNQVNTLQKTTNEGNSVCISNSDDTAKDSEEKIDLEPNANKDVCDALNIVKSDVADKRTDVEDSDANKLCEKSVGKNETEGKRTLDESERKVRKEQRAKEWKDARDLLERGQLDCLIVACKLHPTPIVKALMKFVAPSRPIVVYSQFKEALMDCGVSLREEGGMVNYRLSETWLREYQVLPQRTHPNIQMSGTGGYLFTAITLAKS